MQAGFYALHGLLAFFGFLYWVVVVVIFFRRTKSDRLGAMVRATHHEIERTKQWDTLSARQRLWRHFRQDWVYVNSGVKLVQYMGLVFLDTVAWPVTGIGKTGKGMTLNLGVYGTLNISLFLYGVFSITYFLCGMVWLYRQAKRWHVERAARLTKEEPLEFDQDDEKDGTLASSPIIGSPGGNGGRTASVGTWVDTAPLGNGAPSSSSPVTAITRANAAAVTRDTPLSPPSRWKGDKKDGNNNNGGSDDEEDDTPAATGRLHRAENLIQRVLLNFLFVTASGRMLAMLDCTDLSILQSYSNTHNAGTSSIISRPAFTLLAASSSTGRHSSSSSSSSLSSSSSGMTQLVNASTQYVTQMVVEVVPSIQCWKGAHFLYAFASIILVASVFPAAIASTIRINAEGSPTFFFLPRYFVIQISMELLVCAIAVFMNNSPLACMILLFFVFGIYGGLTFWLQPCLGAGREINHLRVAVLAFVTWAAFCGVITAGIDNRDATIGPSILLILCPLCAFIAYRASIWYQDRIDRKKLESMRLAATSKNVKFQRTAYDNMAILSLTDLNRRRIVEWKIIDSAIPVLADNKADTQVRISIVQALSNIAADDTYRAQIRALPITSSLVAMFDKSGRGARRAGSRALLNAVPRAALQLIGQLSQLPDFCRDLINSRAHTSLLPHILSEDPELRIAAADVLRNLAGEPEAKRELMKDKTLQTLVRLMVSPRTPSEVKVHLASLLERLCRVRGDRDKILASTTIRASLQVMLAMKDEEDVVAAARSLQRAVTGKKDSGKDTKDNTGNTTNNNNKRGSISSAPVKVATFTGISGAAAAVASPSSGGALTIASPTTSPLSGNGSYPSGTSPAAAAATSTHATAGISPASSSALTAAPSGSTASRGSGSTATRGSASTGRSTTPTEEKKRGNATKRSSLTSSVPAKGATITTPSTASSAAIPAAVASSSLPLTIGTPATVTTGIDSTRHGPIVGLDDVKGSIPDDTKSVKKVGHEKKPSFLSRFTWRRSSPPAQDVDVEELREVVVNHERKTSAPTIPSSGSSSSAATGVDRKRSIAAAGSVGSPRRLPAVGSGNEPKKPSYRAAST